MGIIIGAAIGLGGAVVGVPLVLGAVGFTAVGIAAGSLAAQMMSATAIASGGGVASGSLVAIGQSIGVTGLPFVAKAAMTSIGAAVGLLV